MTTTTAPTTIRVYIESKPHTESLDGVVLNRPAPQGGAFLINTRVPREVWDAMKQAGAWYLSQDDLDDFDMFEALPGWRYTLNALAVLVRAGYPLVVRGETVTTEDALRAMFTAEAQAAYYDRLQAERDAEAQQARKDDERRQAEAARKGAEYAGWQAEQLTGLVETFAAPRRGEVEWQQIAYFAGDVPGAWHTTGDTWYTAEVDGQPVYLKEYGNASVCYAPQAIADAWVRANWNWRVQDVYRGDEVEAARWVLRRDGGNCIGDDIATRLVALYGAEHFAEIARRKEWLLATLSSIQREEAEATAAKYGIRLVVLEPEKGYRGYEAMRQFDSDAEPGEHAQMLWRDPTTGQWYAQSYRDVLWPVEHVK